MRFLRFFVVALGLMLFVALGAYMYMRTAMHGFSARAQPSGTEKMLAEYARNTAMPASAKSLKNPIVWTPEVEHEALAHYADHCAICHSNDGSGQTMIGKGMYPKPPDLRRETQTMSDGQLFYIVENGIRMSGMPAFGGEDSGADSWKLVYFLRHLPHLTAAEEEEMESLNPKSPQEFQEEKEEQQFLNGDPAQPVATTRNHVKG